MKQLLLKILKTFKRFAKLLIRIIFVPVYELKIWILFKKNRNNQNHISAEIYNQVYKKYKECLKKDSNLKLLHRQIKAFVAADFTLISDNLSHTDDGLSPVVFVVVRNEINRMKIFFEHYRKHGIENFIVLDNGSDDGTLEYVKEQKGTKVYQILEGFQTQKKEGWIEKLLVMNGIDRWCIVVDSDELLDFQGSENHSIMEMIQKAESLGHRRIWGFMLDMYSKEKLFNYKNDNQPFTEYLRFFDKDSYILRADNNKKNPRAVDFMCGGPRYRVFDKSLSLSKQSVFRFGLDMLYRNCHYMYPIVRWGNVPCWYVLRHYKFIAGDRSEYERRIQNKCFYNNSIEYKVIMNQIEQNEEISFYHEDSVEYVDSDSLQCLPFLERIPWDI